MMKPSQINWHWWKLDGLSESQNFHYYHSHSHFTLAHLSLWEDSPSLVLPPYLFLLWRELSAKSIPPTTNFSAGQRIYYRQSVTVVPDQISWFLLIQTCKPLITACSSLIDRGLQQIEAGEELHWIQMVRLWKKEDETLSGNVEGLV